MEKLTQILNRIEKALPESERQLAQSFLNGLAQCCSKKDRLFLHAAAENLPDRLELWAGVKKFWMD